MTPKVKKFLERNKSLLKDSLHAVERECLRINKDGNISQTAHPENLGSPLTHPYISTDFAECQIEFITPTFKTEEGPLSFLRDIKLFTKHQMKNELCWPFSMPSRLPKKEKDIPLAKYGESREGQLKTLYRKGLGYRYGRRMQTISGIHYNFSFSDKFVEKLHKEMAPKQDLKDFRDEMYFRMIRNYTQIAWLDLYLFGAAPAADKSYINKRHRALKKMKKDTYYAPYGTSLRMSELGYCCQKDVNIPLNNLNNYLEGLDHATSTTSKKYKKIGLVKRGEKIQINDHYLQIQNEYYAVIRPKNSHNMLRENGVDYVEVRTVDINPFCTCGVSKEHLEFLHVVMLYCLGRKERGDNPDKNHNTVGLYGRKPGLMLEKDGTKIELKKWANQILESLKPLAKLLGKEYEKLVEKQFEKVKNPELTPSARLIKEMKEEGGFMNLGLRIAEKHANTANGQTLSKGKVDNIKKVVLKSIIDERRLDAITKQTTEGYTNLEVSTQLIIKEALKRKINVNVIDAQNNFIRLSKGRKIQYVKQATKTSKDTLMTYLIMENKQVTKQVLHENGISVPAGNMYDSYEEAVSDYTTFKTKNIVVKPLNTNYGIGISFPKNKSDYEKAVERAFKHDSSVIVEEFIEGKEYRFLVIGKKVVSIVMRLPANVIGDGIHTIEQLVSMKNADPLSSMSRVSYPLSLGMTEKTHLKKQRLTTKSIPKKGKQIFLRENTNVSTGGDAIEVSDKMPEQFKKVALKAAKSVNAKFCGVDMIINPNTHSIIEMNFNPALAMHKFPDKGKGKDVEKHTLDILGF